MRIVVALLVSLSVGSVVHAQTTASVLRSYTVGTLPAASSMSGVPAQVIDATTPGDCTIGGGSLSVTCFPNGNVWQSRSATNNNLFTNGAGYLAPDANGNITVNGTITARNLTVYNPNGATNLIVRANAANPLGGTTNMLLSALDSSGNQVAFIRADGSYGANVYDTVDDTTAALATGQGLILGNTSTACWSVTAWWDTRDTCFTHPALGTIGLYIGNSGTRASLLAGDVQYTHSESSVNQVSYSATPTFNASLGNLQTITLTGNVTSSTLSNLSIGQRLTFQICNPSGYTFTWPANIKNAGIVGTTSGYCFAQTFESFDGSTAIATSSSGSSAVTSVAGRAGNVVLTHSDITDFNSAAAAASPVKTVNGQTGNVVISSSGSTNVQTVDYSATPTFDLSKGNQRIVLTGDVSSSTAINIAVGQTTMFQICEDSVGGHYFSFPATFTGAIVISAGAGTADANTCSVQSFTSFDGVAEYAINSGVPNQPIPSGLSSKLVNPAITSETRYNDQVAGIQGTSNTGLWTQGDTWFYTWSDDGNLYTTYDDGIGPSTSGLTGNGNNIGISNVSSDLMTITSANLMNDFGTSTQTNTNGWADGATWKTRGLSSIHGALYLSVVRQLDSPPWTISSASILKSTDHGKTWCNFEHSDGTGCSTTSGTTGDAPTGGEAMWSGAGDLQMASPTAVWYCQDNSMNCPSVDGNSTYTYWTSNSGNYDAVYLARVKTANNFQDVTQYQYFTGSVSQDVTNDSNWSSSVSSATPLITGSFSTWAPVYYVKQIGMYVMLVEQNNAISAGNIAIYSSSQLGGPWIKTGIVEGDDQALGYPSLVPSTFSSTGPNAVSVKLATSGSYATASQGNTYPLTQTYSVHYQTLEMTASATSTLQESAGNYTDTLNKTGMIEDYSFLPEPSPTNKITDHSGNGNDAQGTSAAVFSNNALESFNGQGYHLAGGSYTGNDYTIIAVYKQRLKPVTNSVLFSDGQTAFYEDTQDNWNVYSQQKTATITATDGAWNMIIFRKSGGTLTAYNSNSFSSGTPVPQTTLTNASGASGGIMYIGANGDSSSPFSGEVAKFVYYGNALSDSDLEQAEESVASEMSGRGIYLSRNIAQGEMPLDFHPPMAAYSLRKLLSSYNGPAVHISRDNGAETDIGFTTSGDLDTTTLNTFCANTGCYVLKWYDQSGNGNDLVQVPGGAAPLIYSYSTGITSGGRPSISFADKTMTTQSGFFYYGLDLTANAVALIDNNGSNNYSGIVTLQDPVDPANVDAGGALAISQNGNSLTSIQWIRNNQYSEDSWIGTDINTGSLFSSFYVGDGYRQRFEVDGTFASPAYLNFSPPYFARHFVSQILVGNSLYGDISEVVIWPDALGIDSQQVIGQNQKNYYNLGGSY